MDTLTTDKSRAQRKSRAARKPALPPLIGGLDVSRRAANAILALFILVHFVLAFADNEPLSGLALEATSFLAISAAAIMLIQPAPDRLPRGRTTVILALCGLAAVLMCFQIAPHGAPPFAHWHLGATTMILLVLAVRGRPGAAWLGYLVMAAISITWAVVSGLGFGVGVGLVIRHAGTLLAGTLFAVGLHRSVRTIDGLNRKRNEHLMVEATAFAALAEREAHLARVNSLARPALTRLAASHEIDERERAECLLVEASLRDAMRGRALFIGPVIRAARSARARGVEVTLLDDSGDQPPAEMAAVAHAVADELDVVRSGRFTARVLPADRPVIATIVVESTEHRMLVVTPDGVIRA